jgi:hypothetical protein
MPFVYPPHKQTKANELRRKGRGRDEHGGGIKKQFNTKI